MNMEVLGLFLLGAAGGLLNGFIASGAGVIIVPIMVLIGYPQADQASSLAVAVSCWAALFYVIPYYIRNYRDEEWICAVTLFIAGASVGHLGVAFGQQMPLNLSRLMLAFFAFVCLDVLSRHERKLKHIAPELLDKPVWTNPQANLVKYAFFGSLTGFLGGMVGSAGGLVLLPLLVHFTGMRVKQAVYACLAMMAGSSVSALYGQAQYAAINFELGIPLAAGAVVGGFFGCIGMKMASEKSIRLLVKLFLSELGLFMLAWGLLL